MGGSKSEKKKPKRRDPLEPFASKEELLEARENLRKYLETLRSWKHKEFKLEPPSTN